jgi:hypothetical protein
MAKEAKSKAVSKPAKSGTKPSTLQTGFTTDEIVLAEVIRRLPELPDFNKMLIWAKVEDQVVILGGLATATFKKAAVDAARSIASVIRVDNGIKNLAPTGQICICPSSKVLICNDGEDPEECCARGGKPTHAGKKH